MYDGRERNWRSENAGGCEFGPKCFMNRFIKLKADSGLGFFRVLSAAQHIVIYDVTEATRRHLVTPTNSDSDFK